MIRQLKEADREEVLTYLYQEPEFNIFLIGDIEHYGFNQDFQRVYGEYDDKQKLLSVFIRYRENAVYYADQERFSLDYLDIFKHDPFKFLSGKENLLNLIEPYLDSYKKEAMYFCKATSFNERPQTRAYNIQKVQSREDCEKLYDLLSQIKEFESFKKDKEDFIQSKLKSIDMGVTLFIEKDGEVLSTVATTAETFMNAMVVGVATHPGHRQKGYASVLLLYLMDLYMNQKNKHLCLFYDNPSAGKIYMRLGFKPIGKWTIYRKK